MSHHGGSPKVPSVSKTEERQGDSPVCQELRALCGCVGFSVAEYAGRHHGRPLAARDGLGDGHFTAWVAVAPGPGPVVSGAFGRDSSGRAGVDCDSRAWPDSGFGGRCRLTLVPGRLVGRKGLASR